MEIPGRAKSHEEGSGHRELLDVSLKPIQNKISQPEAAEGIECKEQFRSAQSHLRNEIRAQWTLLSIRDDKHLFFVSRFGGSDLLRKLFARLESKLWDSEDPGYSI